jgi:hypothetical protein
MRGAVSLARASGKAACFGLCCNKLRQKRAVKKREIPSQPSGRVKLVKLENQPNTFPLDFGLFSKHFRSIGRRTQPSSAADHDQKNGCDCSGGKE